ncbi:hypothetical protein ACF068_30540 [Streptomyces sp. NPDC016309]|uniref:hypothetical protein n=1 Tax=Streptomyces sp. NPDC016309 TaxID=3364965 RepID=UPI0036FB852A
MSPEGRYAILMDRLKTMLQDPQTRAAYEQALALHRREEAEASAAADDQLKEQLSVIVESIGDLAAFMRLDADSTLNRLAQRASDG